MRKLFSLFAALLFAGSMMAAEVVITPSDLDAAEATAISQTVGDVSLEITNGTITDQQIRIFATETLTLSAASGNITKVVITCIAKDTEKYGPGCFAAQEGNYSYADYVGTWEGEAASVSLTSTGKQVRATEIRVTIGDATPATPAEQLQGYINDLTLLKNFLEPFKETVEGVASLITSANSLIAYGNAILASGDEAKIQEAVNTVQTNVQTVILQVLAKGKEGFAAQLDALLVAAGDCAECQAIIAAAKEALNGLAWDDSKSVQQNIEAIQRQAEQFIADAQARIDEILNPAGTISCKEVYSKAKGDAVALNSVTVTYVNGKNVWVRDASGAMLLYLSANATWKAGDVLTGVEGEVDVYNDLYEVKPTADQVAAVTVVAGEAPAPVEVLNVTSDIMNEYIVMKELALEGEFTTDKSTSINITDDVVLFNKFKLAFTFEAGKTYNVLGVVSIFKGALQVNFISAEESGVAPEPEVVYYLVGSLNGWETSDAYKFAANPAAEGEFVLNTTLAVGDELKVEGVHTQINQVDWFPDNAPNYTVDADHAGDVTIYFRPDGQGGDDWYYGYFYVAAPEPQTLLTCREVYSKAKDDAVALNPVVVTYVNGKNVWVRDASGAMLLYLSANATWEAGDILTGVEGVVDIYKSLYEVKPSADQVAAVAVEHGEAPDPFEPVSLDDVNNEIMNEYIILKGIALEGEFTSESSTSINLSEALVLFNKFKYEFTFEAGKTYDILGVVSIYNSNLQVNFISAEENVAPLPEVVYYLVGSFNDWGASDAYEFAANPAAEGEFVLNTTLAVGDELKVKGVHLNDNQEEWFPTGMGNNYVVDAEHAGDVVVYFRPDGQGGDDWYYGYFYIEAQSVGEVVDVNNADGLVFNDYCSSEGWWEIQGKNDEFALYISNLGSETAPGTYGIDDLDPSWTWYVPANTTDTVHFVAGSVTLTVDEEGAATLVGSLLGDDGKTYRFNLVVSLPETVEVTLNVTNYSFGVASGVGAYISATAEDGTEIQLVFTTDELVAGTYTEEDLNFDKNYNYVEGADGGLGLVQTATIILKENEEGSFNVEAHLYCNNYTLYHIYMTPPVVEREVTVNITNGELDQTYLSYGIYGFSGVDENGVEVFLEIWPDEVPGEFSEADLTNYLFGSGIVDGGVQTSISSISGMIEEQDGAYRVTADALCGNNTLYHITLIVGEWSDAKYYLAGSMNGWAPNADFMFTRNENAEGEEYILVATLAEGDEIKVAMSEDGQNFEAWFPDNAPNYIVDLAHAGDAVIYFRPNGDGGDDWFYGYFYVTGREVVDITITTGLIYKDACATSGWWQIRGNFNDGANFITLSNGNTVTEAPGTYTADVLDVNYSFIRDNDTNDKVTFTDGSITLSVDESGKVIVEGQLAGSDGNLYNIHLEYLEPKAEREVTVTIADGQLDDTYVSYGDYAFSGVDENGVEVFLEIWPDEVPGEFSEADLVTYLQGNGIVDGGVETSFFSITGTVEEQDGAYRVIADALCYNNTLYHITLIVGEWSDAKYYLAGSMNGWAPNADFMFTRNENAEGEEYVLVATLAEGDEIKVAMSEDGQNFEAWFPDNAPNYIVDLAHAGDAVIYFRPNGDGGDDWFYGFFYVTGSEVVDVTNADGLAYADYCSSYGYWEIAGKNDEFALYVSNNYSTSAPGTYGIDDLDPNWTWYVPANTTDTVHFVAGSVTLTVDEEGAATLVGSLLGDDGKVYRFNLVVSLPETVEVTLNVTNYSFGVASGVGAYISATAEDGTEIQLVFTTDELVAGTYTEEDLNFDKNYNYVKGADGSSGLVQTATIILKENEEGSFNVEAHLNCNNYTIYHIYMTPAVVEREVTVNITNGELDQTYLSYGLYGFSGVDENGVEVNIEVWPDEVPGEFSEADMTNYTVGNSIVDGGVTATIVTISGSIEVGEIEGSYKLIADALCGNNTLYHITIIVGDYPQGIEETLATGKAVKVLRNNQIFILKGDKIFNMNGQIVR